MNPVLISFYGLEIRYYGILMALGFLIGYFILKSLAKKEGIKEQLIEDYFVYILIGIIVGARLFEILVYEPLYYFSHPLKMLYVWQGGLASHGAVIGGIVATLLFCWKYKVKFYKIADLVVIPIALGAVFVRIGNFINQEIVGRVTSSGIGYKFDNYAELRHPSQLYEAFKNFVIFILLLWFRTFKSLNEGVMFWSFLFLFAVFRFIVEFWKDWPLYWGLTIGQYLSIVLFVVSAIFLYRRLFEK